MKHYLLVLFTVGFLCFSCSDETSNDSSKEKKQESQVQQNSQFISMNYKEDTKFKKYVTSFAHQLEYYDLIGKINLQSILAKSLAKNDVLINAILSQFENNINNVLNNNPIYFCLKMDNGISINLNPEDLLEENDIKGSLFVFTEVKDIEITKKEIEKFIGIQFTQKDGFYSAHNDQTIFIINNEFICNYFSRFKL